MEPDYDDNIAIVKVAGIGAGGANIINSLIDRGIPGVDFIAMHTDPNLLAQSKAASTLRLGLLEHGSGSDPERGRDAARESLPDIEAALAGSDLLLLIGCLGGGCASGALPEIIDIAVKIGIRVICIAIMPFHAEAPQRSAIAAHALEKLKGSGAGLLVVSNDTLVNLRDDEQVLDAYKKGDLVIRDMVRGITGLIILQGFIIGIDFGDVLAVTIGYQLWSGIGVACGKDRALVASHAAITDLLRQQVSLNNVYGALLLIHAGTDMTMDEFDQVNKAFHTRLPENVNLIIGVNCDDEMEDALKIIVTVNQQNK